MKRLKKGVFLLMTSIFISMTASAEFYARIRDVDEMGGGCFYVTVDIYDDNGTVHPGDDDLVGQGTISVGCNDNVSDPGGGDTSPYGERFAIYPNPVTNGQATVDYLGNEYDDGMVKGITNPNETKSLQGQGLDFKGKETIDLTGLSPGYYLVIFTNDSGLKGIEAISIE